MAMRPVRDILSMLDSAVENCHPLHLADMEHLGMFCHTVVKEVAEFGEKVTRLGLPHPEIDETLRVPLTRCLNYVEARSKMKVYEHIIETAKANSQFAKIRPYSSVSMPDLEIEVRRAVRDRIIEPVLIACERSMRAAKLPMDQRSSADSNVAVFYAIEDMDRALGFGYSAMSQYDQRCAAFDELVRGVKRSTEPHNLLYDKIDKLTRYKEALLIGQETGRCPRVFFMVPQAKSKMSWFRRKAGGVNVFHEKMDLHFVCSMFFDDLRTAVPHGNRQHAQSTARLFESREISPPLQVKIPREFVKKWMPVIKLTLAIVDLLVHAVACGMVVEPLIPGLSIPEQTDLLFVLQDYLQVTLDSDRNTLSEDRSGSCRVADGAAVQCLDASARSVMQAYLDEFHRETWETTVLKTLKIAINKKHGKCAYVCVHNPEHLDAWENKV